MTVASQPETGRQDVPPEEPADAGRIDNCRGCGGTKTTSIRPPAGRPALSGNHQQQRLLRLRFDRHDLVSFFKSSRRICVSSSFSRSCFSRCLTGWHHWIDSPRLGTCHGEMPSFSRRTNSERARYMFVPQQPHHPWSCSRR